jgi:flavodoxin
MNTLIVYFSKSGNTERIAIIMAELLKTEAVSLNIPAKKGKGTTEEQAAEKNLFAIALQRSKDADLLIIGTPIYGGKAPALVRQFTEQAEPKKVGMFCTHIDKLNTALSELQNIFEAKHIQVLDSMAISGCKAGLLTKPETDISGAKALVTGFIQRCQENENKK